jgi:hypothetical protein
MAADSFPVEGSHIMMFARAVGDPNKIYYDEEHAKTTEPGGIIAPPTFAQASAQFDENYSLRPKIGVPWHGSAKEATGVKPKGSSSDNPPEKSSKKPSGGGLHAEQHFEYHRHIGPGDVLTATEKPGKSWEKEGRRAGKLKFSESIIEYRDQNGELVITARGVSVTTERPADQ